MSVKVIRSFTPHTARGGFRKIDVQHGDETDLVEWNGFKCVDRRARSDGFWRILERFSRITSAFWKS